MSTTDWAFTCEGSEVKDRFEILELFEATFTKVLMVVGWSGSAALRNREASGLGQFACNIYSPIGRCRLWTFTKGFISFYLGPSLRRKVGSVEGVCSALSMDGLASFRTLFKR